MWIMYSVRRLLGSQERINQIAVGLGALLFVAFVEFGPNIAAISENEVFAWLMGSASLFVLIAFFQWTLLKAFIFPIRGIWVYRSSAGTYATLRFFASRGALRYRVKLFRTSDELRDFLVSGDASPFGVANSRHVDMAPDHISVIYSIERADPDYAPRNGFLDIDVIARDRLKGFWTSDIGTSEPPSGTLDIRRPERADFLETLGSDDE